MSLVKGYTSLFHAMFPDGNHKAFFLAFLQDKTVYTCTVKEKMENEFLPVRFGLLRKEAKCKFKISPIHLQKSAVLLACKISKTFTSMLKFMPFPGWQISQSRHFPLLFRYWPIPQVFPSTAALFIMSMTMTVLEMKVDMPAAGRESKTDFNPRNNAS